MPDAFEVKKKDLKRHFGQMDKILRNFTNVNAKMINDRWTGSEAVIVLMGVGCEPTSCNRKKDEPQQVAPIKEIGRGLWAWFGYMEKWNRNELSRKEKYHFHSASITVYFGLKHINKKQMFRAEWAANSGQRCAGHPHWHFDVLESLSDDSTAEQAKELRKKLQQNGGAQTNESRVHDFVPERSSDDVNVLISHQKISQIHFPSAAVWWKPPLGCNHVHHPEKCPDLQIWLRESLSYLRSELDHLK